MNLPHHWRQYGKIALIAAGLTTLGALNAPASRADHNSNCQVRLAKADHRLHEAIEHHGYRSGQADHARRQLADAREHCYTTYHEWWDEDSKAWHSDRDWKEDDHEHYRDKDKDHDHDNDHR